jgi:acyl-coenzyme A synthetase/AMP-(fatty) acid ligase
MSTPVLENMAAGAAADELIFRTSGTTGEPMTWVRSREQVEAEATLLAELCGAQDRDGVVCFAPPTHLYGHLMGVALPRQLGLPCRLVSVTAPVSWAFARLRRPLVAVLPAALATLTRGLPALRRLDDVVLVHGSAVLTPAMSQLLAALGGSARLVDLFGSTETGLVASRHSPDAAWTTAPDVQLSTDSGTGRLRVHSPRIAHQPGGPARRSVLTEDVVTLRSDHTFRWIGRSSRLVKVNGHRVYLDQIEAQLRAAVPDVTSRCEAGRDPLRGEWFRVLVEAGDDGLGQVQSACLALPGWQRPREVLAA